MSKKQITNDKKNASKQVLEQFYTPRQEYILQGIKILDNIKNIVESVSKNSIIAKNGVRAEVAICLHENIKQSFELYFNLPIKCLKRIHGKKSDIKIYFENGNETTFQNKDGGRKRTRLVC